MEGKNIKILIVDDDVNVRKTFSKILKLKGYTVEGAGSYSEALSSVKAQFFNIVIIDVRLPDASGLELLKAIRELNEDIVPIMATAYASVSSSIEAVNQGAYSYITKPVDMDQALMIIERAVEKQRLSMENRRLLQELKSANEKLKELDKRKSAFVANVSHEFKNPLTTIKESLSLVVDGAAGEINSKQKKVLTTGKDNIERLLRLVMDLLDLSKIESGKMEMKREEIDLVSLVNGIVSQYEGEISKKKQAFKKDIPQKLGSIWADKDKLTEVIINLLSNAIKYTPSGGNITVKLEEKEKEVRFEISDTGPGIPKEHFQSVFDKFERITAEKEEGTGLGLPIAKDIIELHKGKIWVESESGKGSKFIFVLPRDFRGVENSRREKKG